MKTFLSYSTWTSKTFLAHFILVVKQINFMFHIAFVMNLDLEWEGGILRSTEDRHVKR